MRVEAWACLISLKMLPFLQAFAVAGLLGRMRADPNRSSCAFLAQFMVIVKKKIAVQTANLHI
jgi:hypothetical protein